MPLSPNYLPSVEDDPVEQFHPKIRRSVINKLYELYDDMSHKPGRMPSFNKILNQAMLDLIEFKTR